MKPEITTVPAISLIQSLILAGALLLPPSALAQSVDDYPTRPVTIVVTSAAGSSMDILGRSIAPKLAERLKQAVLIENRVGASGIIGANSVAKAAPDGYTLLATVNTFAILPAIRNDLPYDIVNDFVHITKVVKVTLTLALSTNVKANNVRELVALIKANPGKFTFSSPGPGSPHHMAGELLRQNLLLEMTHVPHKDLALAIQNVVGGHVDMIISSSASVIPGAESGKLKLLANSGTSRSVFAPDVPTFTELGYQFMSDVDGWYLLSAPVRTPASIVARLNREFRDVLGTPEARDAMRKMGSELETSTPEQAAAFVKADVERWIRVIKQGKVTVN